MKTDRRYNPYRIDTHDIWEYERNAYIRSQRKENWEEIEALYDMLQGYILESGAKPFLKNADVTPNDPYLIQYRNHFAEKTALDFFVCKGDFYDMQEPCVIYYHETSRPDFEILFLYKLRQYKDKLHEVKKFLQFQLKENFKHKFNEFEEFLHLSFLQHPGLVDERIVNLTMDWLEKKKEERSKRQKKRLEKSGQTNVKDEAALIKGLSMHDENAAAVKKEISEDRNVSPVEENLGASTSRSNDSGIDEDSSRPNITTGQNSKINIPEGYITVEGDFSIEEIQHYFSFLYKETDDSGKAFLKEPEVKEIFKYGLAIPPKQPEKRYRLHCSLKFPKSIVEYCIYIFYTNHTASHNKRVVLKFFASYIMDFESALKSEKNMQIWCDNVGRKPRRIKFAPGDYLPERHR